jgi:hypothetical protein
MPRPGRSTHLAHTFYPLPLHSLTVTSVAVSAEGGAPDLGFHDSAVAGAALCADDVSALLIGGGRHA